MDGARWSPRLCSCLDSDDLLTDRGVDCDGMTILREQLANQLVWTVGLVPVDLKKHHDCEPWHRNPTSPPSKAKRKQLAALVSLGRVGQVYRQLHWCCGARTG